jgi:long-chain acyl-CoA synthetase
MNLAVHGEQNVERFGAYDAYFWQGVWHTNVEAVQNVKRFANVLVSLGVRPGDRVAVMLPNCVEVFFAYAGTLEVGPVVVPLPSSWRPDPSNIRPPRRELMVG